ncbi:MAG: mechanosensitive ion channel family protein [Cyanobacteria bacterium J06639_14]
MSIEFLERTMMGNTIASYLLAIAILLGGILLTNIIRTVIIGRLQRWAKYSVTDLDDRLLRLIQQPTVYLLYLGSFYISIGNLTLHPILKESIDVLCVILATLAVIRLTGSLVEYGVRVYWVTRRGDVTLEKSLNALIPAIKIVVWAIGLIFLLDNLGFDISAVVTSLGIGGVAVALASQGILADLFSYFSILFDRPFEIGDFLIVGDLVGTVEHIGIKTTRLRSISGEELIVSNTNLTESRIQNFRRMRRRRIVFTLGVTYDTSQNQMAAIPGLIQAIIEATDDVTFDRVHFDSFGDFSLNYEVVYHVESGDYEVYTTAQQQINLAIKAAFEEQGIEFAYPTQWLYLANATGQPGMVSNGERSDAPTLAVE